MRLTIFTKQGSMYHKPTFEASTVFGDFEVQRPQHNMQTTQKYYSEGQI